MARDILAEFVAYREDMENAVRTYGDMADWLFERAVREPGWDPRKRSIVSSFMPKSGGTVRVSVGASLAGGAMRLVRCDGARVRRCEGPVRRCEGPGAIVRRSGTMVQCGGAHFSSLVRSAQRCRDVVRGDRIGGKRDPASHEIGRLTVDDGLAQR